MIAKFKKKYRKLATIKEKKSIKQKDIKTFIFLI